MRHKNKKETIPDPVALANITQPEPDPKPHTKETEMAKTKREVKEKLKSAPIKQKKAKPKASPRNGGPSRRSVVLTLFQKGTTIDGVVTALKKNFGEEEKSARRRTVRILRKAVVAGFKKTEKNDTITLVKPGAGGGRR